MYYPLARKMVVLYGQDSPTQAYDMRGESAVEIDTEAISTDTTVNCWLDISNDLQNWIPVELFDMHSSPGVKMSRFDTIAAKYVRLRFVLFQEGTAVMTAGVNTAPE